MKIFQAIIILTPIIASSAKSSFNPTRYLRRELQEQDTQEDTLTFDDPTHHGKLVDYCLTFQDDCGKPAADRYCEEKHYGEAIDFPKRQSYDEPTLTLEEHATCSPEHNICNTFDYITCRVKTQTFYDPKEHTYALDSCLEFETECGKPAADAFCENQGYGDATEFVLIEAQEKTMTIGNHAVCDHDWHECSTFASITCIVE